METSKHPRCRDCKHIVNFNKSSDRYWHCDVTHSAYATNGRKPTKRMNTACDKFENKD
jgi:ribosomal protein L37AE/L43A